MFGKPILFSFSLLSLAAMAYDGWLPIESCLQLQSSDSSSNSSFENGKNWAGGSLPTSEQDCWVPSGLSIRASAEVNFPGKSLTIDDGAEFLANMTTNYGMDYLRLLGGSTMTYKSIPTFTVTEMTVDSTSEKPVVLKLTRDYTYCNYPSFKKWLSTAASKVILRSTAPNPAMIPNFSSADFTGFKGILRVERTAASLPETNLVRNTFGGSFVTPGSLEVGRGVIFERGSQGTILAGSFSMESNALVSTAIATPAFVTVSNRLTLAKGAVVRASGAADLGLTDSADKIYRLFALKGDAAQTENLPDPANLDVADFVADNYWGSDNYGVFDDPLDPGAKVLGYRCGRPLCQLLDTAMASGGVSTFTNAACWKGGVFPSAGQNAYVTSTMEVGGDFATYAFPCAGVIIKNKMLFPHCGTLVISNLFLNAADIRLSTDAGSFRGPRAWNCHTLRGDYLGLCGTTGSSFNTLLGRALIVDYPIHGDLPLRLTVRNGTSYPYGGIELKQANTNFHGRMTVASDGDANRVDSATGYRLKMFLSDARNLGGDMKVPTFDGLTLRGDSILLCDNSVDFNQVNRGVYVQDRIRVVMTNQTDNTFTVSNPLTFGGEFVFGNDYPTAPQAAVGKGGGTLVLCGKARFYDPATLTAGDLPGVNSNKLTMLIGKLRVAAADAVDGVAVTFGAESDGLELDFAATALGTTGFVQTKSLSALNTLRADGKIPVSVKNLPQNVEEVRIAVCTVPSATVVELLGKLKASRIRGYQEIFETEDVGGGQTRVTLAYARKGMAVIFR